MNIHTQTRSRFIVATALVLSWLTATLAFADTIYQSITQAAGSQWNQAYWGTPAAIPVSTNHYITTNGFNVRTPDSQTASTFLGASLQIDTGGQLYLKNGGAGAGVATANLILNGGSISLNTANGTTISAVAGTLQVIADSTIRSLAGAATRDVWLRSTTSGNGNLTVGMVGYSLVLFGTNTAYSGNWTVNSGRIEVSTNSVDALGSGSVNLTTTSTSLLLNNNNDFTVNNAVSGPGVLVKLNTNTATLGGNNSGFYGTVVVSNGVLRIQSAASLDQATFITLAGGSLDATPVGALSLNGGIGQTLNCRGGSITAGLTASSGSTLDFNLTPTTNDILNVAGPLTLNGNPTLNLNLAGFKPAGTNRLINYTGTIQGGGSFNLVPPVGSSQIFTLDTSTPGQVNLVITGLSQNLVWVGDGGLNSWDTYSPNWNGGAFFATGDNVTFDDTGSAVPDIYLPEAVIPNNMTVSNTAQAYTFYDQGISTVGKLTKAGGNDLVFTSPSNNFTGPVEIQAGTLSVGAGGASGSLGNPGTITNNGLFRVNLASGGPTLDSVISGTGAVEVIGGGVLYLRGSNSYTGLTTVGDGSQLNITTNDALGSAVSGTVVQPNGRLGVNGLVGALTIPEPITVSGTGLAATPGALYVNTGGNNITWAGPVTINGDVRFRVVNAGARMNFSNTVLGSGHNLQASAETDAVMTFLNTLDLGGGTLIKDAGGTVVLGSANNTAGSTVISNGTLLVHGVLNGGAVTVNSSGTLGGTGTNLGPVSVLGGGTIAPGSNSVGRLTVNNPVTLSGTALMQLNRTNALNADQLVASSTDLGGTLTVVNIGPSLEIGDTFSLFAGPLTGAFAATNLPALPPYQLWDTTQLGSSGVVSVITNVAFQPLIITDIQRQPGNVTVTWQSNPGQTYNVEYSLDLLTWTNFVTGIPASAGTTTTQVLNTAASGGLLVPVAKYDMTSTSAVLQDGTNLVAAAPLTPGSGVNAFTAPSFQGYPTDPILLVNAITTGTDLTAALANQAWFTFTLTVGANVTDLDLTSLTFNGARGGGATPRGYAVYATTPTTTDELVKGATDFATQRPVWGAQNVNLSALASLQNLTAGQVVTITIPFYSPSAGGSVEFDDITVNGIVSPAPVQPPYVGAGKMFLRIKQQ